MPATNLLLQVAVIDRYGEGDPYSTVRRSLREETEVYSQKYIHRNTRCSARSRLLLTRSEACPLNERI